MNAHKLVSLLVLVALAATLPGAAAAQDRPVAEGPWANLSDGPQPAVAPDLPADAAGGPAPEYWPVVATFPAFGHPVGLDYYPAGDYVAIGHQAAPASVYNVDYATHGPAGSFLFSEVNFGWPATLDSQTGVEGQGYSGNFLGADYQGDGVTHDDYIVEYDSSGLILRAWEMDDDLGSNDSSNGGAIDGITDVAYNPWEYYTYVTAKGDGSVVYRVILGGSGLWQPGSWYYDDSYEVPGLGDNAGIAYDADHHVFIHSDWQSNKIAITTVYFTLLELITCPGAGGYNSGVAYVEGKEGREIWVTDYTSGVVTVCRETPPPPCVWEKVWPDDFENGLYNWWRYGLWNLESEADTCGSQVAPFPSPSHAAYYGIDGACNYDSGPWNNGSMYMWQDADLTNAVDAELRFWSYEQTEGDEYSDRRYVIVSPDGGADWMSPARLFQEGAWYQAAIPLGPYVGGPLRAGFYFAADPDANNYFGWMVDDVEIWGCFPLDIEVNPDSLSAGQFPGEVTQQTLEICAEGTADLHWSLAEEPPAAHGAAVPQAEAVPPYGAGRQANPILLIATTDVSGSVRRALDELGYAYDYYFDSTFSDLPVGAHVIAHEPQGAPTMVEYGLGGGHLIALAQPLEFAYYYGVEGGPILPNLLLWGSQGAPNDVPWLRESSATGTVPGGQCSDVTVTFDSTGLPAGDYRATLAIYSNDPDEAQVTVPVGLSVFEHAVHLNRAKMNWRPAAQPGLNKVIFLGKVHDELHTLTAGITVQGTWTYPDGTGHPVVAAAPTNNLGQFKFPVKVAQCGLFQFDVTGMSGGGYAYAPRSNDVSPHLQVTVPCR